MNNKTRTTAVAITGLLALGGAAACGSSSSGSSSASSTTSAAPAGPVVEAGPLTLSKGVHTQVILDSGFVQALGSLHVTPGVIGTATLKGGTLTFPITSGSATYYKPGTRSPYVVATIQHQGSGISLSAKGIKVGLSNFVVDATNSQLTGKVTATAKGKTKVVGTSVPLFFLNGRTLQPLTKPTPTTAVLYGTKVYLTSGAAQLLDQTFGTNALTSSTLIGTAKITLGI